VKHNRIKPKPKKQPKFLKWLHEVRQPPCFVCGISVGIQAHHVKEGSSDYRDDTKVIPLCHEHHLGVNFSAHGTPKAFREEYPIRYQEMIAEELFREYENDK